MIKTHEPRVRRVRVYITVISKGRQPETGLGALYIYIIYIFDNLAHFLLL